MTTSNGMPMPSPTPSPALVALSSPDSGPGVEEALAVEAGFAMTLEVGEDCNEVEFNVGGVEAVGVPVADAVVPSVARVRLK